MSNVKNMTSGNPLKLILTFAFPLIITNIGQQFYMIVDAAIVGRGVGVKALASVGAADWIYWLILWSVAGLTQGFATFVARYFGNNDYRTMSKVISHSIILSIIGAIFTFIGLVCTKPLLTLLKTPSDIMDGAVLYLYTMISGTLVVTAYNMSASILRAFGNSKAPLIGMIIAALTNIGLDLLFVLVFKWGIFGAAIASVTAQGVSFIYCIFEIRKIECIEIQKSDFRIDFSMSKDLLFLGLPLALQNILISVSGIVLQSTINLQGSIFVAGYTATNKLYGLLECSAISLGLAVNTFFSQNYGAKQFDRVKKGVITAVKISEVMAIIVSVLMLTCGRFMLQMFIDNGESGGPDALNVAHSYLVVMLYFLVLLYPIHVYRNALLAIGNSYWAMISGVAECIIRVIMAKIVIGILGIEALYFTEPLAWVGAFVFIVFPYYFYQKKLLN